MGMGFGKDMEGTHILESGSFQRLMDMEFTLGEVVIGMKENGNLVSRMVQERIFSAMVMCIQDNTFKVDLMDLVNIFGMKELNI